jgi:hypothetical protein
MSNLISNEKLLSYYYDTMKNQEVFVYLQNANLQGIITQMSLDFFVLCRTENGNFVLDNQNKKIETLISISKMIDISPVVKNYGKKSYN